MLNRSRSLLLGLTIFLAAASAFAQEDEDFKPGLNEPTFKGLKWRGIGPALMSGRIADVAVDPIDRSTWYVAVGSGGVEVRTFNSALLTEPWEARTKSGGPFRVFTPFWRAATEGLRVPPAQPAPASLERLGAAVATEPLESWDLWPTAPDWAGGLQALWRPGERGAQLRLDAVANRGERFKR